MCAVRFAKQCQLGLVPCSAASKCKSIRLLTCHGFCANHMEANFFKTWLEKPIEFLVNMQINLEFVY